MGGGNGRRIGASFINGIGSLEQRCLPSSPWDSGKNERMNTLNSLLSFPLYFHELFQHLNMAI